MNKACALFLSLVITVPSWAASTDTVTTDIPAISTATAVPSPGETSSALSELNYKIEYLHERYLGLGKDIDELRAALKDQRKALHEQGASRPDPGRLKNIETEIALLRADVARTREEVGIMQSEDRSRPVADKYEWMKSPWIPVAALAISFIALVRR